MFEKVKAYLEEMNESDLVYLHNQYCYGISDYDNEIFTVDDFFDNVLSGETDLYNVACRVFYGDFNPQADYIKFSAYGNYQSIFKYDVANHIYIDDIADYIVRNNDPLYNDELKELLEEFSLEAENERAKQ